MAIVYNNRQNVVLFSGGLDSLCTLLKLQLAEVDRLRVVYVDLDTDYTFSEIAVCQSICDHLNVSLEVKQIKGFSDWSTSASEGAFIPYRNLILSIVASGICYNDDLDVWVGGLKDDCVIDSNPDAFLAMSRCLSAISEGDVQIRSMWWNHTKKEMVHAMLAQLGERFVELCKLSLSCYRGTNCGDCPSCFRKWAALEACDISCSSWFALEPEKSDTAKAYATKIQDKKYDSTRRRDTVRVLKKFGVI